MSRTLETARFGSVMPMLLSRAILCMALALACAAVSARSSAQTGAPLLGSYCGDYRWHGTSVVNAIRLDFQPSTRRPDSKLEVEGVGWATTPWNGVRTRFSVRAVVDLGTGRISMTETVGSDAIGWVTDGSYEGQVQPDGSTVVAIWTNRQPPRNTGVLRLRRCGPSDPAV
jgi:hypothetical protein